MVLKQLEIHMQKTKVRPSLPDAIHKTQLNGSQTYYNKNNKICRRIIGVNLCDLGLGNGFLDMKPKAQATKENNNNLGFIKIENFCATSDVIRKVKKQLTE